MSEPHHFHTNRPERHHDVSWDHPAWFIMRELRRCLGKHISQLELPVHAAILDYGCATQPYRDLFPETIEYTGADLPGNDAAHIYISEDGTLPVQDACFDVVLSTQVLEHVLDPDVYVQECLRVLRPGGYLILSTHGLWIYHRDPIDYWRWTADGLCYLVERIGFQVVRLEGLMGLTAVSVQLFQDATYGHLPRLLRGFYSFIMQRIVALFDRLHSPDSRIQNAMVYLVVAQRPREP